MNSTNVPVQVAFLRENFAALFTLGRLENLQSQVNLFNVAIQGAFLRQQFTTMRTNNALYVYIPYYVCSDVLTLYIRALLIVGSMGSCESLDFWKLLNLAYY